MQPLFTSSSIRFVSVQRPCSPTSVAKDCEPSSLHYPAWKEVSTQRYGVFTKRRCNGSPFFTSVPHVSSTRRLSAALPSRVPSSVFRFRAPRHHIFFFFFLHLLLLSPQWRVRNLVAIVLWLARSRPTILSDKRCQTLTNPAVQRILFVLDLRSLRKMKNIHPNDCCSSKYFSTPLPPSSLSLSSLFSKNVEHYETFCVENNLWFGYGWMMRVSLQLQCPKVQRIFFFHFFLAVKILLSNYFSVEHTSVFRVETHDCVVG